MSVIHATPRIAVLMPAFNAEGTIIKSLASLAANSMPHDIIIVDDGSTIPLASVIVPRDNITILRCDKNIGLTPALNKGLGYILNRSYEFIARMDADDVTMPGRLEKQSAFLHDNPDYGLVGSRGYCVDEAGTWRFPMNYPTDNRAMQKKLLYHCCFFHSALMIRADTLRTIGIYDEVKTLAAEDYELVRRIAKHYKVANLPDYLIDYTIAPGGMAQSKRRHLLLNRLRIQWRYRHLRNLHFYLGMVRTCVTLCFSGKSMMAIKLWLYKNSDRNCI